ncbi:CPBP family glutamic-type intramembrane protease [Agromyces sp. G08B096]|uniref:CPBP family glutamic-type intramembrane protease n=1 Tax=Agromyces sp. G08B096 TaxID=3156399 RepID=A0AAU7WC47_9MICO
MPARRIPPRGVATRARAPAVEVRGRRSRASSPPAPRPSCPHHRRRGSAPSAQEASATGPGVARSARPSLRAEAFDRATPPSASRPLPPARHPTHHLGFFAASIVLLLVGFTEEMATRGLLLVGLRSRLHEGWVWFISTAAFAVMHLTNALGGQGLDLTMTQVGMAFLGGTVFYILRRTTGTLIWAMVLHGLWDFSTFAVGHGTAGPLAPLASPVFMLAGAAGLIVVAFVIRGANERTSSL